MTVPSASIPNRPLVTAATLDAFDSELTLLRDDANSIAYALRREAEALRQEGARRLLQASQTLQQLRERVETVSRAIDPSLEGGPGELPTINRLQAEVLRRRRELPIRTLLQDSQRLRGALSPEDEQRLQACRRELELRLAAAGDGVEGSPLRQHPLSALLRLVQPHTDLSDADWEADQLLVRTSLGPSIAVAAARGRLTLSTDFSDSRTPLSSHE